MVCENAKAPILRILKERGSSFSQMIIYENCDWLKGTVGE
jgi:hypothetical protein